MYDLSSFDRFTVDDTPARVQITPNGIRLIDPCNQIPDKPLAVLLNPRGTLMVLKVDSCGIPQRVVRGRRELVCAAAIRTMVRRGVMLPQTVPLDWDDECGGYVAALRNAATEGMQALI